MIDRTQVIYEFLTATSTLSPEIGSRVYSPVAPRSWDNTAKTIIYHQDTSDSHLTGATNSAQFIFKCYSGNNSYADCRELFGLLYDRLQMASETTAGGTIISARLVSDDQLEPEPDTKHKAHMARFVITFEGS